MPRIVLAGHGTWKKSTRRGAGRRAQAAKPYRGFTLEIIICLGILVLGIGIHIVGTSVL